MSRRFALIAIASFALIAVSTPAQLVAQEVPANDPIASAVVEIQRTNLEHATEINPGG